MNKITPEQLRAWVDGELSPERDAEIKALVANDSELAALVESFEASKLPYKAAMNLDTPAVPADLQAQVKEWSTIADTNPSATQSSTQEKPYTGRFYQKSLAAAVMLLVMSWAGMWVLNKPSDPITQWTNAVVNYQNFYAMDTVKGIQTNSARATEKLRQLKESAPAFPSSPPDLVQQGYAFKRLQQLDFENKPILQMVFFKEGKRPLAICLMPDDKALKERFTEHELLNSYVWQNGKLRGIVVGEESMPELKQIASLVH